MHSFWLDKGGLMWGVWSVLTCLFADDTVLLAESEGDLQRVVNEFNSVCKRRTLNVNAFKSNVLWYPLPHYYYYYYYYYYYCCCCCCCYCYYFFLLFLQTPNMIYLPWLPSSTLALIRSKPSHPRSLVSNLNPQTGMLQQTTLLHLTSTLHLHLPLYFTFLSCTHP